MSILIKGMQMPKNCGECKFFAWQRVVGNHCAIDESITFHATLDGFDVRYEKNGNCPIIEIPPHGRLIDADALRLLYDFKNYKPTMTEDEFDRLMCTLPVIRANIDDAPTIIEAEGEDG